MQLRKASWTSGVLSTAYRWLGQSLKFEDFRWMQQSIFCWQQVQLIAMSFPVRTHVQDGSVNWNRPPPSDIFSYVLT